MVLSVPIILSFTHFPLYCVPYIIPSQKPNGKHDHTHRFLLPPFRCGFISQTHLCFITQLKFQTDPRWGMVSGGKAVMTCCWENYGLQVIWWNSLISLYLQKCAHLSNWSLLCITLSSYLVFLFFFLAQSAISSPYQPRQPTFIWITNIMLCVFLLVDMEIVQLPYSDGWYLKIISSVQVLHYAWIALPMFSNYNMCLQPVNEVHPLYLLLASLFLCWNTQFWKKSFLCDVTKGLDTSLILLPA